MRTCASSTAMDERWLPIPGYEGSYEVSDQGRVRSLDRVDRTGHRWQGRMIRLHPVSERGYLKATLYRDGKGSQRLVHRLVLEAFVGPCPEGMEACHGDGDTTNNELSNLRWGTSSENNYDIVRHGNHHHAVKTSCKRGHQLVTPNLNPSREQAARGWRRCKACARETDRARWQRRPFDPALADAEFARIMRGDDAKANDRG